jgi:hypothetical protein
VKSAGIHNEHHTHSYLSIAHGLVDLSVATGEPKYLAQAKDVFDHTLPSVWLNGDVPEGYGQLFEHRDETCSAVDWTLLALKLFDATAEVRYLDVAELSVLNQLFQGQDFKGGFTCYRSLDRRHWMDKSNYGGVHQACCSMHGGLALGYVATHVVTRGERGLSLNLLLDVDVKLKDLDSKISQRVDVEPHAITQNITVTNNGAERLPLTIRIPYWCKTPKMTVDGKSHELNVKNGFANVTCSSSATTNLVLSLPITLTLIPARTNVFTMDKGPVQGSANEKGLQLGPFALMVFREMYPKITDRQIKLTVPLDSDHNPQVTLESPPAWRSAGAYNLFVKAQAGQGKDVTLTPCANCAMAPFSVVDPYVLRFDDIAFGK